MLDSESSISDAGTNRARTTLDLRTIKQALQSPSVTSVELVYYQGDREVAEMVARNLGVVQKHCLIEAKTVLLGDVGAKASPNGTIRLKVRQILRGGSACCPSMMTPTVDPGNVSILHGRAPFGVNGNGNPGLISVVMQEADYSKLHEAAVALNARVRLSQSEQC